MYMCACGGVIWQRGRRRRRAVVRAARARVNEQKNQRTEGRRSSAAISVLQMRLIDYFFWSRRCLPHLCPRLVGHAGGGGTTPIIHSSIRSFSFVCPRRRVGRDLFLMSCLSSYIIHLPCHLIHHMHPVVAEWRQNLPLFSSGGHVTLILLELSPRRRPCMPEKVSRLRFVVSMSVLRSLLPHVTRISEQLVNLAGQLRDYPLQQK